MLLRANAIIVNYPFPHFLLLLAIPMFAFFPQRIAAFSSPAAAAIVAASASASSSASDASHNGRTVPLQLGVNTYNAQFGIYIGPMQSADGQQQSQPIVGHVFAVNESAIQLVNFTFNGDVPDTFFWLDHSEMPTREGIRLRTFEYGISPLGPYRPTQQVLLVLPEMGGENNNVPSHPVRISQFRTLSLFSLHGNFMLASVRIPDNLLVPKTQLLPDELRGTRYDVQSGPIQILDTRTIKIFGFTFQGDKAPDGYFYVGRGLNVNKESGVKAAIRGRDTFELISPMSERYTGGKDIYVELPEGYDVHHIDWLSVYCVRFEVDYGHIFIRNIAPMIPPHVPSPKRFEDELDMENKDGGAQWHFSNLLGIDTQRNFTFQLGPAGGNKGYRSMMRVARPPKYVWYVNGYMATVYLKRGVTYTFIVEGGHNATVPEMYNPFYVTDSPYGGYAKLSNDELTRVRKYTQEETGRLCRWMDVGDIGADEYTSFVEFRDMLRLECDDSDQPALVTFTPGKETPDTLYYGSYTNYQMGGPIHIVDEFPADLKDIVVEPYRYDSKRHQERMELTRENSNSAISSARTLLPCLLSLLLFSMSFSLCLLFVKM